jgi:hypothetical protein
MYDITVFGNRPKIADKLHGSLKAKAEENTYSIKGTDQHSQTL